jgi:pre-mRNA-splicing factor CWC26
MTDMKAYLAQKYMSGPKADAILSRVASKKKKKRKADSTTTNTTTVGSGARLLDEDGPGGWVDASGIAEDAEDLKEAVVEKDRGFKKRKVDSGWATIQEGGEEEATEPADEQPMVVDVQTDADARPFVGGLVSAQDLRKVLPPTTAPVVSGTQAEMAAAQETVYRDAQGRKIDTGVAKAEAARRKREREEKEASMMEWGKGLVQREEKEKMREAMEKGKGKGFSRYADDKEMNEEMKARELWSDPAATFLTVRSCYISSR